MAERIQIETGKSIDVMTFHKLGKEIIAEVEGKQPRITRIKLNDFIKEKFRGLLKDPNYALRLNVFFLSYLKEYKSEFDFKTQGDYFQYLKDNQIRTLKGETVKSYEEEVEKGLAGVQSFGRTDGRVTARVFGQFLTWLQEKKSPVFVIATANAVEQLPPEFLRKGRFDEIFFVDLPTKKEREEIFRVQLKKRNRNPKNFDMAEQAKAAKKFTGAEIEEAVVVGMFTAWNNGQREVTTEDILDAVNNITPMANSMADRIENLRSWAKNTAKMANAVEKETNRPTRVIRSRG
jgi:SpoVK/Ycf46/Vps4 family AAA+-type ATPase